MPAPHELRYGLHDVCPDRSCQLPTHAGHVDWFVPAWLVPGAHSWHVRSAVVFPANVKYDPGLHVVKCLHVVCPGASCHPELHAAQKLALPTVDTAPAGHAVHARFTDAVPLVDTYDPAEQLVQYAHAARPALDVNVEPLHVPHTVFTSPSHPLT